MITKLLFFFSLVTINLLAASSADALGAGMSVSGASQGCALAVSCAFALDQANENAPRLKVASRLGVNAGITKLASIVSVVSGAIVQLVGPLPVDLVRRPRVHGFGSR